MTWLEHVDQFHLKFGFSRRSVVESPISELTSKADALNRLAIEIDPDAGQGNLRAHLVVEEAGELVRALADGDEVGLLDAVVDLIWVTVGTAVTFDLPLDTAWEEVRRSNMTKTVSRDRPGHPGKGDGYSPPDLKSILRRYRNEQSPDDQ